MKTQFLPLETPESLQLVRDVAEEVWPKTFAPILPPEQIPYMMRMMYAPEVMELELAEGYRFSALLVDGAPSGYVSVSETKRAIVTGGTFYTIDPMTRERDAGVAFSGASYSYAADGLWHEIEWQWQIEYLVTAAAASGGSVSAAEQWAAVGETVTVSATPASGASFYRWTGDVPASVADTDASITFAVPGPVSLTANFGGILYVAEDGDDNNDGSSPETAFATIEKAIASVTEGGLIRVCAGEYRLTTDRVTISKALTLAGYGSKPATSSSARRPPRRRPTSSHSRSSTRASRTSRSRTDAPAAPTTRPARRRPR